MGFDLDQAIEVLERTPGVLSSLLAGLDGEWLLADEGEGTFSPKDVLAHLVHGEQTDWVPRIRTILEHGTDEPFEPFEPHGFEGTLSEMRSGELLQEFHRLRVENLREVKRLRLTVEQLDMEGTHPEFGAVTLRQLMAAWAVHDLGHIAQIVRVMAGRYREDVGPWRAFLSILGD
jgi:hypothetical protein